MSARKPVVFLTRDAERDFEEILLYTRKSWGSAQTTIYRRAISAALMRVGEYPMSGRARPDLFPGCRTYPVDQHIIFYRVEPDDSIAVMRILHTQRDIDAIFDQADS